MNSVKKNKTNTKILDTALLMLQTRGYNGFSYADICSDVGIRKASVHYYFPNKADLGREIMARCRETEMEAMQEILHKTGSAKQRLKLYIKLFGDLLSDERMCPG